VVGLVRKF